MNDFCIPNISDEERRKRLMSGVVIGAIGLAVLVALLVLDISRWWRLVLAPLFFSAASSYFQWRDKTWVGLAARGSRQLGKNVEKIEDKSELAQVRKQARSVQFKALAVALAATLLAILLP